jgi:hypothetical protein
VSGRYEWCAADPDPRTTMHVVFDGDPLCRVTDAMLEPVPDPAARAVRCRLCEGIAADLLCTLHAAPPSPAPRPEAEARRVT